MRAPLGRRGRRALLGAASVGFLALAGCDLGAPPTTYTSPGGLAVLGDLNGDGHEDVLTGVRDDGVDVLFGDGAGGFTAGTMTGSFGFPNRGPALLADANGDGFDDLFFTTRADPEEPEPCNDRPDRCPPIPDPPPIVVFGALNNAGGAFGLGSAVHAFPPSLAAFSWGVADIDGNGTADFAASYHVASGSGFAGEAVVRLDLGAPVTTAHPVIALGPQQIADVDGDGHPDLVIGGALDDSGFEGAATILWGDGTASFAASTVVATGDPPATGQGFMELELGDVDGDGQTDIVGVNRNMTANTVDLAVFRGTGARSFAPVVKRTWTNVSSPLTVADFDGDGADDVVESIDGSRSDIRFGGPGADLSESRLLASSVATTADFDEDGKPDLIARVIDGIRVFLNRWDGRP